MNNKKIIDVKKPQNVSYTFSKNFQNSVEKQGAVGCDFDMYSVIVKPKPKRRDILRTLSTSNMEHFVKQLKAVKYFCKRSH